MFEEFRKPLNDEQIEGYMARIGLAWERGAEPTLEYLNRLIKANLRHIPFENATSWATGAVPSLKTDELYDKIITRRRGGFCFELNSLFWKLLKGLGFDSYLVIVHLRNVESENDLTAPAHCAVITTIDGKKHFADVGLGGVVPDGTVEMDGEEHIGYQLLKDGVYSVMAERRGDIMHPKFTFKDMPCDIAEFIPLDYYVVLKEGSIFANGMMLNLRADNGYAQLGGWIFKYKSADEEFEREIRTPQELKEIAEKYFGIPDLPVRDTL